MNKRIIDADALLEYLKKRQEDLRLNNCNNFALSIMVAIDEVTKFAKEAQDPVFDDGWININDWDFSEPILIKYKEENGDEIIAVGHKGSQYGEDGFFTWYDTPEFGSEKEIKNIIGFKHIL